MIDSFKCKDTELLFNEDKPPRKFRAIAQIAKRKLDMLDAAISLMDLRIPPGNRLHALQGDRLGQYSISINDQYRICFEWDNGQILNVEIVDYH